MPARASNLFGYARPSLRTRILRAIDRLIFRGDYHDAPFGAFPRAKPSGEVSTPCHAGEVRRAD